MTTAIKRRNSESVWQLLRKVIIGEPRLDSVIVLRAFADCNLIVPIETYAESKRIIHFEAILSALFSIAAGTPIGNGFRNLKDIENWIFNSHTCHYLLFLRAVRTFRRGDAIEATNMHSTASKHIKEFRAARTENMPSVIQIRQDRSLDAIFRLGFPELAQDLQVLARSVR